MNAHLGITPRKPPKGRTANPPTAREKCEWSELVRDVLRLAGLSNAEFSRNVLELNLAPAVEKSTVTKKASKAVENARWVEDSLTAKDLTLGTMRRVVVALARHPATSPFVVPPDFYGERGREDPYTADELELIAKYHASAVVQRIVLEAPRWFLNYGIVSSVRAFLSGSWEQSRLLPLAYPPASGQRLARYLIAAARAKDGERMTASLERLVKQMGSLLDENQYYWSQQYLYKCGEQVVEQLCPNEEVCERRHTLRRHDRRNGSAAERRLYSATSVGVMRE